jgi:hypothetical protein
MQAPCNHQVYDEPNVAGDADGDELADAPQLGHVMSLDAR